MTLIHHVNRRTLLAYMTQEENRKCRELQYQNRCCHLQKYICLVHIIKPTRKEIDLLGAFIRMCLHEKRYEE